MTHKSLGAAHASPSCPQSYTGSLLPGYLGQIGSHKQRTFTLGVNLLRTVEAQCSIIRLTFLMYPVLPASYELCLEWTGKNYLLRAFM